MAFRLEYLRPLDNASSWGGALGAFGKGVNDAATWMLDRDDKNKENDRKESELASQNKVRAAQAGHYDASTANENYKLEHSRERDPITDKQNDAMADANLRSVTLLNDYDEKSNAHRLTELQYKNDLDYINIEMKKIESMSAKDKQTASMKILAKLDPEFAKGITQGEAPAALGFWYDYHANGGKDNSNFSLGNVKDGNGGERTVVFDKATGTVKDAGASNVGGGNNGRVVSEEVAKELLKATQGINDKSDINPHLIDGDYNFTTGEGSQQPTGAFRLADGNYYIPEEMWAAANVADGSYTTYTLPDGRKVYGKSRDFKGKSMINLSPSNKTNTNETVDYTKNLNLHSNNSGN